MGPKLRFTLACAALTPPLVSVAALTFGQAQTDWRYKVAGLADPFLGRPAPEMSVIVGLVLTAAVAAVAAGGGLIRWTTTAAPDAASRVLGWSWLLLLVAGWAGYAAGGATVVEAGGPAEYRASLHWEFGAPLNSASDVSGTCRTVAGQPERVAEVRPDVLGLPAIQLRDEASGKPVPLAGSTAWEDAGDYSWSAKVFEPANAPERVRPYLEVAGFARQPISFVRAYNYRPATLTDSQLSGTARLTGSRFEDPYGGGSLRWVNLTLPGDPWPSTYEVTVTWTCTASSR